MNTYHRVLTELARGKSIDSIAEEFDRRPEAIDGMIDSMRREGHLEEFGCKDDTCKVCPFADSCPTAAVSGPKSYFVTESGVELIERASEKKKDSELIDRAVSG